MGKCLFMRKGDTHTPPGSILPSGYTELAYIQSSGTQYVDSGITINSTTYKKYRFLFDIGYPSISGSYWLVNGNSGSNVIYYFGISNTGKIVYGNGTTDKICAFLHAFSMTQYLKTFKPTFRFLIKSNTNHKNPLSESCGQTSAMVSIL